MVVVQQTALVMWHSSPTCLYSWPRPNRNSNIPSWLSSLQRRFKCYIHVSVNSAFLLLFYSEESSAIPGVGVEKLVETGKLEFLKDGPLFWVDSADSQPCMGEGVIQSSWYPSSN